MPRTGPYVHWARGDIVLTVSEIGCNGKSPTDAKKRLRGIAKELDKLLRDYWQMGPRAKGISFEIREVSHQESKP